MGGGEIRAKPLAGKVASLSPSPHGERVGVRGLGDGDWSRTPNPLSLPSPRRGEGKSKCVGQ
jgi:hypothetical protein